MISLAQHLAGFTTLTPPELTPRDSPAERERRKGLQQRAEDLIYTLNHAITCLSLTDFLIAPFFSTVFGWNICGHGHDHGADGHAHHHSSGGSGSASSTHEHFPGCGHDTSYSSSAGSSASVSSSGSPREMPGTTSTNAAEKRVGGGMRRSRPTWRDSQPLIETDEQKFKRLLDEKSKRREATPEKKGFLTGLTSSDEAGEEGARLAKKRQDLCELAGEKIDHSAAFKPTPSYISYSYTPYPPPKPGVGQRVAAWWKELTTSPLEYLKSQYPGFKEWAIGEAAGDIGAVPLTLAVQHFTPGVMMGIQRGLEPIVGRLMHKRAERAAERWADKHGIARDAEEVVTRAQELYQYEIRHLPQMVMWTLSSVLINYGVMKYRNPELLISTFAKGKAAGSAITAGIVFGARTFAPDKAHAWDSKMGGKVVVPITKKVGRLFGIEERDVEDFHKRSMDEDMPDRWTKRVEKAPANTQEPSATLAVR